jgi:NADH dehydrogenase
VISGANGAVGQNLIRLLSQSAKIVPTRIRALVRDLRRADKLRPLAAELIEVNYRDPAALREAVEGAEAVVHLAGALKPRLGESLWEANGETALNILEAARPSDLKCFVFLSHPGADLDSRNGFLQAKGIVEREVLDAGLPGAIFRVPMILGQGNDSLERVIRCARAPFSPVVGGGAVRVQPVSQVDVVAAIEWALSDPPRPMRTLNLAGPETLTYADLLYRVANRIGRRPRIFPVPKFLARLVGWSAGAVSSAGGNDRAALDTFFTEYLERRVVPRGELPFSLAPVNETLDRIFPLSDGG